MPLTKSGSKQAISQNISEMVHAGHPQDQAVAAALSTARKYGKKSSGGKINGKLPAPSIGGVLSKKPWKGYKRGGIIYKDDGGSTPDDLPDVGPAPVSDGGQFSQGSPWANKAADIGSKLAGNATIGAATLPYRYVKGMVDAAHEQPFSEGSESALRNVGALTGEMGMQMMGRGNPEPNTSSVFVGPYGAHMLRDADRSAATPHPVIGEELKQRASTLRPEFQDIYKGAAQDMRDAEARGTLEMRQGSLNGPQTDRDVFPRSGWSYGAEGMPRKEIPDTGAKLVKNPDGDGYLLDHPAGDLHGIYDVPPIKFDAGMKIGNGRVSPDTNQITIGGAPTKANLEKSVTVALHEMQHAIQKKEGFAKGANYAASKHRPEMQQEYFPDDYGAYIPSWNKGLEDSPWNAYGTAHWNVYQRNAGEAEARNVQGRRAKSYRYQSHPEDTEDVTRGLQWVDPSYLRRDYEKRGGPVKKAFGGGTSVPWFERQESRGMTSGLLHGTIPGRTDKKPLNVAGGSYVVPSDIVSAVGQGNTISGAAILKRMMTTGPFGMALGSGSSGRSSRAPQMHMAKYGQHFAGGGDAEGVSKIIAADGEFVITPEEVRQVGGGDIDRGHRILDAFIKHMRKKTIKVLKSLPGPKRD